MTMEEQRVNINNCLTHSELNKETINYWTKSQNFVPHLRWKSYPFQVVRNDCLGQKSMMYSVEVDQNVSYRRK